MDLISDDSSSEAEGDQPRLKADVMDITSDDGVLQVEEISQEKMAERLERKLARAHHRELCIRYVQVSYVFCLQF